VRSEKINTQACLRGYPGTANWTNPAVRMQERDRIIAYWPEELLKPVISGTIAAPPWRMLLDPTAWKDIDPVDVHDHVRTYLRLHGRWPSLDWLRRRYGRVSNHRGPDEVPAQGSLL
jgi:hypothetical protein